MKPLKYLAFVSVLGAALWGVSASAAEKVVIGDIDDMSGPYADVIGARGVEAIKMAIADFGGGAWAADRAPDLRSPEQAGAGASRSSANGRTGTA